jgi:hypothetical protein
MQRSDDSRDFQEKSERDGREFCEKNERDAKAYREQQERAVKKLQRKNRLVLEQGVVHDVNLHQHIIPSNTPGSIIIQQQTGEDDNGNFNEKTIDDGNCGISKNGLVAEGSRIICGYTSDGLPFQIVVSQGNLFHTHELNAFIDTEVTPLMDTYAEKLSNSESADEIVKELITELYKKRFGYLEDLSFHLSVAITYQKNDSLRCAGFGIGDRTGMVLVKGNDEPAMQLTCINQIYNHGFPYQDKFTSFDLDAFENLHAIDQIIERNSTFDIPVEPTDVILGYTNPNRDFLMEPDVSRFRDNYKINLEGESFYSNQAEMRKFGLQVNRLGFKHDDFLTGGIGNKRAVDNCIMGYANIPDNALQDKLKNIAYRNEKQKFKQRYDAHEHMDEKINLAGEKIHDAVCDAEQSEKNIPRLTRALAACNRVMIDLDEMEHARRDGDQKKLDRAQKNLNELMLRAKNAKGGYSTGLNVLGGLMITFGLIAAAVGGVILIGSLGLAATGVLAIPGTVGVGVGAGMIGGGLTLFAAGVIACRYGRHKGVSKAIDDLGGEIKKAARLRII